MRHSTRALEQLNLPTRDELAPSAKRFPDGGQFRIEIPSTEGLVAMRAALQEADRLDCPVHRFSQGSGIQMLGDEELREICEVARDRNVEFCPFVTPRANWGYRRFVDSSHGESDPVAEPGGRPAALLS